jgi:AGZA family xanthine/uracil permease-like MFS transporter
MACAVFIIDRDFRNATIYAAAAAVLSFFGLIHGTEIGVAVNLDVVVGYVLMAGITGALWLRTRAVAPETETEPGLATEAANP